MTSQTSPGDDPGTPSRLRHPVAWIALVVVLTALLAWAVLTITADVREDERQDALAPFYQPPDPLPPGEPGSLIRTEPLGVTVAGGTAWRILYRSEDGDGTPTASSGMVFIPDATARTANRPVVSWAHGTIGLGDACAPSRLGAPTTGIPWVEEMLARGWVVAATDYAGLGTPGTSGYLVSAEEGPDVINAVRAARAMPQSGAGRTWIAWGHSQGGHSALAAGRIARAYAPELDLVGVAAAAPAADLRDLLAEEWDTAGAWVIGGDVVGTWPDRYPELDREDVLTANGEQHWRSLLEDCVGSALTAALLRQDLLGQDFFRDDPWDAPAWRRRFIENTPRPLPGDMPLLIAQSTTDTVVLPQTTASLIRDWCAAGDAIDTIWIGDTTHAQTAIVVAPSVIQWMTERLRGTPAGSDCDIASPVPPLA